LKEPTNCSHHIAASTTAFTACASAGVDAGEESLSKSVLKVFLKMHVQPIAFGVSFKPNVQSQSPWSLFNGTWQKRPRELDYRSKFENEEMTLQMQ